MTDAIWAKLPERTENRTAFLAALIMERCKRVIPAYNVDEGAAPTEPRFNPYQAQRLASYLVHYAEIIKRLCERECSEELAPHLVRRKDKAEADFAEIAEFIGMNCRTGGDPRGACAYLIDRDDPRAGDGWGDGWAVYA